MKKILNITALILCVAVVIGMGVSSLADSSINSVTPNKTRLYQIGPHSFRGYVQVQPSYNDNGKHAQAAMMWLSSVTNSTDAYAQTPVGTNEGDTRILSDDCTLTVQPYPQTTPSPSGERTYPPLDYRSKFIWQPHTGDPTRPWAHPFSFSPIENMIEPQLVK